MHQARESTAEKTQGACHDKTQGDVTEQRTLLHPVIDKFLHRPSLASAPQRYRYKPSLFFFAKGLLRNLEAAAAKPKLVKEGDIFHQNGEVCFFGADIPIYAQNTARCPAHQYRANHRGQPPIRHR